ncbi:hypothetical protein [Carnobacterium sp.]|uniref:hypothetical protein n=1 Tax=Carnobacterium sp. TaxID=48221 RepID=UPI0038908DC6
MGLPLDFTMIDLFYTEEDGTHFTTSRAQHPFSSVDSSALYNLAFTPVIVN